MSGLHQWGAVTLFHGLPSDRVRAIAQGPDGAMWFGTDGGLAKFDGRRTQVVKDPLLPAGRVLALLSDPDGILWIGTESGAATLAGGRIQPIRELEGKAINAIIAPQAGRAIMAVEQGMVYECINQSDGHATAKPLLNEPLQNADRDHPGLLPLTSLTVAHDKLLAGSLSRGLLVIENGAATEVQARKSAYFIRALATDSRGHLWVGQRSRKDEPALQTGDELNRYYELEAPTGSVMALQTGRSDDVWVGTDGRGVFHFLASRKIERLTFDGTLGGLRSDHVYSIFIDREDVIWFGTDRGVCRFDGQAPRVESVSDSAESNFVRTLYQTSKGRVLAGTNRGLFVYDESKSSWRSVAELAKLIVYAIAEDDAGKLLIGSASGLYVAQTVNSDSNIETMFFSRVEASSGSADAVGSIRAIGEFRGARYIASYGRGLERLNEQRPHLLWPESGSGDSREVLSLGAEGNSRLLIGTTRDGVLSFDGQTVKADPTFASLKGSAVRSIARTVDGSLWFATSRGVFLCKPQSECLPIAPNFDARFLLVNETGNQIWCATTGGGLLKILFDAKLGSAVSQLDVEQGLPSQNVFAVLRLQDLNGKSTLLVGTSRGVVRYQPGYAAPTLYATRIISKRVHQTSELASGLQLEYPQNSLLLDVAAISSRTFPEQFQYAFMLFDDKETLIRQKLSRESQFAMEGLPPGKYRVTATAFSKDLVPSAPLSFGFDVAGAPFPWTSTALAVLLAFTLLALLWALLERRRIAATSAALVAANRELADARLNLANEAERERRRIARDLHDQTLADLRHLMLLTDQFPANGARGGERIDTAAFRGEIESISQEVRRICEDLSPSVLQNVGFAAALEFALSHATENAAPEKRLTYEFSCDESLEEGAKLSKNVQMQIYRIVQEAVHNIWRHAGATWVKMSVTNDASRRFLLVIEDNGQGFVPALREKGDGRGIANMRARASLIDAEISWEQRASGGTVFTLTRLENDY